MTDVWIAPLAGGLLGAIVGSFTTTMALRSVAGVPLLHGRSRCDSCGHGLSFAATVPLVSYAVFGGACRDCRSAIDPRHPIGEVTGGIAGALALAVLPLAEAVIVFVLAQVLLASSIIDSRSRRLPDALTAAIALLCAGLAALRGLETLAIGIASAAVAYLLLETLRRGYSAMRRRPGLGGGDVKLVAALALWLGLTTPWAMVAAAGIGLAAMLVLRPADGRIAFGPAIAASAFLVGLGGSAGRFTAIGGGT